MRKSPVWGLLALILLVPSSPAAAAGLSVDEPAAPEALQGQLLVADPQLGDPNFDHTVVLILEHDAGGTVGVVVNRPYGEAPTAELLRRLGVGADGVAGQTKLFYGGPVQSELGLVVHSADYALADTHPVGPGLAVTSDPAILKDIATGKGPHQALPVLGYAGWGPGQLESELAQRAWFVVPPDPALIFAPDASGTWQRAIDRRGIEL